MSFLLVFYWYSLAPLFNYYFLTRGTDCFLGMSYFPVYLWGFLNRCCFLRPIDNTLSDMVSKTTIKTLAKLKETVLKLEQNKIFLNVLCLFKEYENIFEANLELTVVSWCKKVRVEITALKSRTLCLKFLSCYIRQIYIEKNNVQCLLKFFISFFISF